MWVKRIQAHTALVLSLFYLSVGHVGTAGAVDLNRLENETRSAYDNTDPMDFESKFEFLRAYYRQQKRFQEEAWTLRNFDFDQEASVREAFMRLALKTDKVVDSKPLSEEKRIYLLLTLENGMKAVFRPAGPQTYREILVYEVDRILGFQLVPMTVTRARNGVPGTLQAFIADAVEGGIDFRIHPYTNSNLHILDYLTFQQDRHGKNWLIRPGGYPVAADNGLALGLFHENVHAERKVMADDPPLFLTPLQRLGVSRLEKVLLSNSDSALYFLEDRARKKIAERAAVLLRLPGPPANCEPKLSPE